LEKKNAKSVFKIAILANYQMNLIIALLVKTLDISTIKIMIPMDNVYANLIFFRQTRMILFVLNAIIAVKNVLELVLINV
jgi:hypothetical protein